MRLLKNVFPALVLLGWWAVALCQQDRPPPTPAPPAAGAETRAPPPAAGSETRAPPPASPEAETAPPTGPIDVDEQEFIPSEELSPDAAITFPVNI